MSSIGQSAFEVVHQLGNELGMVKSNSDFIRGCLAQSPELLSTVDGYLSSITAGVGRCWSYRRDWDKS